MRDWTSENERYDAQCKEPQGIICSQCGERCSEERITHLDGNPICDDCLKEYIEEYSKSHAEDFTEDFISENLDERSADYWENDMSDQQRKEVMRLAYLQAKQMHKEYHAHDIEESDREFCFASDDYTAFVRDSGKGLAAVTLPVSWEFLHGKAMFSCGKKKQESPSRRIFRKRKRFALERNPKRQSEDCLSWIFHNSTLIMMNLV